MSNCYFYHYYHHSHKALPQDEQELVVDEAITGRSHPKSASHQLLSLPQLPQGQASTQSGAQCTQVTTNTSTTRGTKVLKYSSTAFQAALLSCHLTLHQGSSLVGLSPIEHLVSLSAIEHYCSCNSLVCSHQFAPQLCDIRSNSPLYSHLGGWNKGEIWLCSSTMCSALICLLHYTIVLVSPRQV